MVDTPRDGQAWCDTVNLAKPGGACYLRVAMDPRLGYRYERLTPTEARRRAAELIDDGNDMVTIYQSRGGKMEAVAVAHRGSDWVFMGAWENANAPERQDDPNAPVRLRIRVRANGSVIEHPVH